MSSISLTLLDFWYDLYLEGYPIGDKRVKELLQEDYIPKNHTQKQTFVNLKNAIRYQRDYGLRSALEIKADSHIQIISKDNDTNNFTAASLDDDVSDLLGANEILTLEEEIRSNDNKNYRYNGSHDIRTEDWRIPKEEILNYDLDFWMWINSINKDFERKLDYYRFNRYVQQAIDWLSDEQCVFNPLADRDTQLAYLALERQRCIENSLYGLNKFLFLKEGEMESGKRKYRAWESQAISLYLFDCYLCYVVGKIRQIGETSTLGGAAILRTALRKSYFTKFITEKTKKGFEIFDDKVRFGFNEFPNYLKPSVNNDSKETFVFKKKEGKGDYSGADSKFVVEAPYATAINGGSPNLVLIDEIGTVPGLNSIVENGRVTLFWINPDTGKLELKRQAIMWGTGGKMDGGGGEMEVEWNIIKEQWLSKDFSGLFVPLFFSWKAKPGLTREFIQKEKERAYAKGEEFKIIFHQTYAETEEEMFLVSAKTLLPISEINKHLDRIAARSRYIKYGYMVPIYDTSKRVTEPDSDVPYQIKGARFVQTSGLEDEETTVIIFEDPVKSKFRYYKGTDPIFSQAGHSKFASVIRDKKEKKPVACLNVRSKDGEDYRYCFLQSLLLGIWYDPNIKDLVENNVGETYISYVKAKGFKHTLVRNQKLDDVLHGDSTYGFRKTTGVVAKFIVGMIEKSIHVYGHNNNNELFWRQVKTFVKKTTSSGAEVFGANNKKIDYDDVIDADAYSVICEESFKESPIDLEGEDSVSVKSKPKARLVMDANGRIQRVTEGSGMMRRKFRQ